MKKLLSILLAALMLLPFTVPAFAADTAVSLNETKSFSIDSDECTMFSFTPETTGIFEMELWLESYQYLSVYAESEDSVIIDKGIYGYWFDEDDSDSLVFCATGGTKYTIYFNLSEIYEELPMKTDVKFTITQLEAKEIKTGENIAENRDDLFIFIPDKSGYYNFRSDVASDIITEIMIYDPQNSSGREWYSGSEYDNGNFNFTRYFEAGKGYAVCIDAYDSHFMPCYKPVSFTILYNPEIKIDYMEIYGYFGEDMPEDYADGDTLTLINGHGYSLGTYIRPDGVEYLTHISAVSGNESKLIAEYSNDEQVLYLNTKKVGRTTLTLTADDGTSIQINVKIKSMFIAAVESFFKKLGNRFCEWIIGIFAR